MESLFWVLGPLLVTYLLLADWWDHGHWPLRRTEDEDEGPLTPPPHPPHTQR